MRRNQTCQLETRFAIRYYWMVFGGALKRQLPCLPPQCATCRTFLVSFTLRRQSAPPGLDPGVTCSSLECLSLQLCLSRGLCPSELTAVQRRTRARMLLLYPARRRHGGEVKQSHSSAQKRRGSGTHNHADPGGNIAFFLGNL